MLYGAGELGELERYVESKQNGELTKWWAAYCTFSPEPNPHLVVWKESRTASSPSGGRRTVRSPLSPTLTLSFGKRAERRAHQVVGGVLYVLP
jgi:hypothetical protein